MPQGMPASQGSLISRILRALRPSKKPEEGMDEALQGEIVMYGTTWCGDTKRARAYFDQNKIPYRWVDIDADRAGREYVMNVNRGYRSVPTIVFPDGSILVEPTTAQLAQKFGKA